MRDFVPALMFSLAVLLISFTTVAAAPEQGEMAVVFPPFTSEQAAWTAILQAGAFVVAPTRLSNIVVIYAPSADFQQRARAEGALLFVKAEGLCAPLTPKELS